ncbi:MAG: glycosyltransferase family 4 protein [Candidatus Omnitrophica bacterium]|nr:glycosyltransferase family 4 protein [Candidatus Omnitrophota bacterium]
MKDPRYNKQDKLANVRICLFFTYEMSLQKWDELGIFDREIILYNILVKRGIEVAFFTYGDRKDLDYGRQLPGIKIIPAYANIKKSKNRKLAFLRSFLLPFKFRKILSSYDIFKTNQMWGAWVPLVAKLVTGRRLLVRCGYEHYYTLLSEKSPKLEKVIFYIFSKIAYFLSDHIIVTTKKIKDFIHSTFSIDRNKISIVPNIIDTEAFNLKNTPCLFKDRIVFIGRLNHQKNIFSLIGACKKAGVGLDLIGHGELREELEQFTKIINANVNFLGVYRNNLLPGALAKYPIFILPSFYEGNPKALIEAMSCGKAVIGTNVGGIVEIIKDGDNGILCGTSSNDICAGILRIKNNIELQKKVGLKARQYVLERYSIPVVTEKELKVYHDTLSERQI